MDSSSTPFQKTAKILASSSVSEAVEALRIAMQSSHEEIRNEAFRATVTCRNQRGLTHLIREFDQLAPEQVELLKDHRQHLTSAIRASLLSESPEIRDNAMAAMKKLAPVELLPSLLHCLEQGTSEHDGILDWGIRFLTNELSCQFTGNRPKQRLHEFLLAEIVRILQKAFGNWRRHERDLFISVFLKMSPRMTSYSGELAEMTSNPKHPAYPTFLKKILHGNESEVLQFIIHSLEKPAPPSTVLIAAARRTDRLFLKVLLEAVGYASETFQNNLKRIHRFEWTSSLADHLDKLDQGYHRFFVDLIRYSGLADDEKNRIYEIVAKFGNAQGRLALVRALTDIRSRLADMLILELADDPEPEVQSAALLQIRHRGIRNATAKLMQYIDSPHVTVKKAIHRELPEFRMKRFLEMYPRLTQEQRRTTLAIIQKLDPDMMQEILYELRGNDPERQDRALELIAMSRNIAAVEESLVRFVQHTPDPPLKMKALKLLTVGSHARGHACLCETAEADPDPEIRKLATQLLEIRENRSAFRPQTENAPVCL